MLGLVLIEVGRAQRRRVFRAQLKDVSDLDPAPLLERSPAQRTVCSSFHECDVSHQCRLIVASQIDVDEVKAVAVSSGNEIWTSSRFVRYDRDITQANRRRVARDSSTGTDGRFAGRLNRLSTQ